MESKHVKRQVVESKSLEKVQYHIDVSFVMPYIGGMRGGKVPVNIQALRELTYISEVHGNDHVFLVWDSHVKGDMSFSLRTPIYEEEVGYLDSTKDAEQR